MRLIFSLVILISVGLNAQTLDTTLISYQGGIQKLNNEVFLYLTHHGVLRDGMPCNRNFNILFTVNPNGEVGEKIAVFSVIDTLNSPKVIEAIRNTSGKWINHIGKSVEVCMPIYVIYYDKNASSEPAIRMSLGVSQGNGYQSIVYLSPMYFKIYKGAVDYGNIQKPSN